MAIFGDFLRKKERKKKKEKEGTTGR